MEFRPPLRRSKGGVIFAVVFSTIALVGAGALGTIAAGSNQVSYTLRSGKLLVDTGSLLDGKHEIPTANITDARVMTVSGGVRTRGTGAPGLCTGQFWYVETGPVWQATDCSRRVVMLRASSEDRPILLSPPDPEGFVAQLASGPDGAIVLPPGDVVVMRVVPAAGALVLLVTAIMLGLLFVAGPFRMRYLVRNGQLTIETIFSRRTFDARDLRARAHVPTVTLRLMGTAFPGYYTGLFRADGVTTRVYATQVKTAGVLLEGPARVFVSPADPAAFLAALAHAGAAVS